MPQANVQIIELPFEDEWPHPPGPSVLWQESIVLAWQDVTQSIGGFFRIGHHPNKGLGICTFGIVSAEGPCFSRSRPHIPISETDRFEDGFSIDGFLTARFTAEQSRWTARDADCEVDLLVDNLHPLYDTWALSGLKGPFRDKFASEHTEVAGAVTGRVRLGARTWDIQGFAYRDHSWGVRNHHDPATALTNFIWLVGSFGPDLVIAACETVTRSGGRFNTGFVIRDGRIEKPMIRDIALQVELDGLSMRGAHCRIETPSLGSFDLTIEGFGNVLMGMECEPGCEDEYLEVGMPGRMRLNERIGGVHVSTMLNSRSAVSAPSRLFGASFQQGVYERPRWTPSGG